MARTYKDPEGVIKTVLTETESMVSLEEIRAFMRQALARGEQLDDAIGRCFETDGPTNSSDSQLRRFRAAADQMWSREAERFDPSADAMLAPLRDDVLVLVKHIADWIRSLDERELDPSELPAEPMQRLGEMSGMLNGVVELINRGDETRDEEVEHFRETLRMLGPIVDQTIGEAEQEIEEGVSTDVERWVGKPTEPESIFVLGVSLVGITPKVWRQVRVPGDFSLGDLHEVIQVVMGWYDDHLHAFAVGDRHYANTMDVDDPEYTDEETVTLDELGLASGSRFTYIYDFGDAWKHTIRVSRVAPASAFPPAERKAVVCTAGERAAPPEDCGGVFGYSRMLELLARPRKELDANEREFLDLFADEFDPDEFDIDAVNRMLRGETE